MDYRVIIAGGRKFDNYKLLCEKVDFYLSEKYKTHKIVIVSGMATGADMLGCKYARDHALEILSYPADWEKYGKAAGPIRNEKMAKDSDALIAFWDGESRGTKSMIDLAKTYGLKTAVIRY